MREEEQNAKENRPHNGNLGTLDPDTVPIHAQIEIQVVVVEAPRLGVEIEGEIINQGLDGNVMVHGRRN